MSERASHDQFRSCELVLPFAGLNGDEGRKAEKSRRLIDRKMTNGIERFWKLATENHRTR
ncbi:hypothetical protein D3C72_2461300 [compost metagenome]